METQQTPAVAEQPAAPSLPDGANDLDTRAAALFEQITGDQKAVAREATHPDESAKPETRAADKPVEAAPVGEKTPEQIAEERRQRIAARDAQMAEFAEGERAKVAASRAKRQDRQAPAAAPQEDPDVITIRVRKNDPKSIFDAFEAVQTPPQMLAEWLTKPADPGIAAKHAAKEALSPVERELAEIKAALAAREQRDAEAAEQAHVAQLVEHNHHLLANHLDAVRAEAPLAATFATKSPAKFRRSVEAICDGLPPGFTAQDVIDQLEEELSDLQLNGSTAAPVAQSTAKQKPPAAVKANVGNRLAAERATTIEDDGDDAEGDLESRARRLKARLAAAG